MLLTLEEQDRRRWRRSEIADASRQLGAARGRGPYVLQAAIAQGHATAQSAAVTRWDRIVGLYDELLALRRRRSSSSTGRSRSACATVPRRD